GTNASGTAAIPSRFGIVVFASNVLIGGITAADRNVISGYIQLGVQLVPPAANVTVSGNYVGLNAAGNAALPNGGTGVALVNVSNNVIGGALPGAGNVISGNGTATTFGEGINIFGGGSNVVQGNLIGTDATGVFAVPNVNRGMSIVD